MAGQNKTLEIKCTYKERTLEATWDNFRPYGEYNINGGGYIDFAEPLTKKNTKCKLNGTYNSA